MATADNERYVRHILLLGEGGLLVLRRLVEREAAASGQLLEVILLKNKALFKNILPEQKKILFPPHAPVNADVNTWDMTILMIVVKRLFLKSLNSHDRASIYALQTNRNDIQGHPTEMSITAADYAVYRTDVTNALQQLASGIDPNTLDEVDRIISRTGSGNIDIQSAISSIQELHEFKTDLLNAVNSGFDITNSKMSDVDCTVKDVRNLIMGLHRRMAINDRKQKTGEALQTVMRANCDEKEKEKEAINLLFNFVEVIQGKNEYDEEQIKRNIKSRIIWNGELSMKLIDDLCEMFMDMADIPDAKPGPARLGSILIPMQYSSLTGLLEVMAYMDGHHCRSHLSAISYTVGNILGFSCSFSWTVITQDLQDVIETMSGQLEAGDKLSESQSILLPFQSTSLTGLIHVWRMFGEGKRNRHLEKISETLSKIVGAQISLMTSVDLDHCVEALYKTERPCIKEGSTEIETSGMFDVSTSLKETGSTSEVENKQEQERLKRIQEMGSTSGLENKQEQGQLKEALSEVVAEEKTKNDTGEAEVVSTSQKVTGSTSDATNKQEEGRLEPIQEKESTSELENKQEQDRFKVSDAVSSGCIHPLDLDLQSVVSKKCRCSHYTVSVKCWPSVYKSQQVIKDLGRTCTDFENMFGLPEQQQKDLLEIDIYIGSNVEINFTSLLVQCDKSETNFKGIEYLRVSQRDKPDESFSFRENFHGIYIDKEGVKIVEAISSDQINVVVPPIEEKESFVEQPHQFQLQRTKDEISAILELVVFEVLTVKFNILKQLYEQRMHVPFNERDGSHESSFSQLEVHHKDNLEQLLGEIIAFFKRSSLPENKRPVGLDFEKKEVSKEVIKQLFRLDETIRGCGYSQSSFNVNVERLSDEEKHIEREKHITDFLKRNGITNIKFNIISKTLAEYKHECAMKSVSEAAEPSVYHYGTLGGFASFSKETETTSCALFSRHVALGCSSKLYVDGENGQPIELGEILEDTLKDGMYDIAAAKIHDHQVQHCDVQFKNSKNVPLPGKLHTKSSSIDLQDLKVHLWGATSRPGLGIIRIPELSFPGTTETYMQIEDRNSYKRMAVEGDSGAIVCADDLDDKHVHVISMLIGSNTDKEKLKDPNVKRTYIALPIQKGVECLQMLTGGTFSLKGVNNDHQNLLPKSYDKIHNPNRGLQTNA
ncbi:uncharacterized protein LOC128552108 isoform X2 [Mercenaria mercenaria]|uniref:uncharacterized protein LOC128552108 isoform X2 n=1 Tax=Mercenaria mercenaria TaxID=6596 RepID=UPI00234F27E6|nr:uncharacterized protein LOC128552108 isoform X2 [Mercenaria mercenaria]